MNQKYSILIYVTIILSFLILSFVELPQGKAENVDKCQPNEIRLENGVKRGCIAKTDYDKTKKRILKDYESRERRGYDFDINDLPFITDMVNLELAGKELKGYTKENFRNEVINLLKK